MTDIDRATITDGFGNYYPKFCQICGYPNEIVRPGKIQCPEGCDAWAALKAKRGER